MPSADVVNWGIIGAGAIARAFAIGNRTARHARLMAVASRDQAKADAFGDEYAIGRRYGSYEAILADADVQAIYICTPHPMHIQWAIRAAEAGKHLLVEKPIGMNRPEALAMQDAARAQGVFLMEAFMYRCHPQTHKLVELIRSGAIGRVQSITSAFGFQGNFNPASRLFDPHLGGGGILDVGCYPVSVARLVAGVAMGKDFAEPVRVGGAGYIGPSGVDDWATATLQFEHGIIAQVSTGVAMDCDNSLHVTGTEGTIHIANPWVCDRNNPDMGRIILKKRRSDKSEEIVIPAEVTTFCMEQDVASSAILAGRQEPESPAMTWADTAGNMLVLDQWRQSSGLAYPVELPSSLATMDRRPLRVQVPQVAVSRPITPSLADPNPAAALPRAGWIAGANIPNIPATCSSHWPMPTATVPHLNKRVSRLVMGVNNQPSLPHAALMFDAYYSAGGNSFDTAHIYGQQYSVRLGQWMAARKIRDELVLIAKGAHSPLCYPQVIQPQLEAQLDWLKTDYADIYFLHRDNLDVPVGEFVDALNKLVRAGRIRAFGGSNWTLARVAEANAYAQANGLQGFSAISNNISLAEMVQPTWPGVMHNSDAASLQWLIEHQLTNFAWSSQGCGFFPSSAGGVSLDDPEVKKCWVNASNLTRRQRAIELAAKKGVDPINIALAYVLALPFPSFALIGPRVPEELRSSLRTLSVDLSAEEMKFLVG